VDLGGSAKFGRKPNFPKENKEFFLECCFWHFPSEYNSSNGNQQFGPENEEILGEQFSS
jgi:hypothetical protein